MRRCQLDLKGQVSSWKRKLWPQAQEFSCFWLAAARTLRAAHRHRTSVQRQIWPHSVTRLPWLLSSVPMIVSVSSVGADGKLTHGDADKNLDWLCGDAQAPPMLGGAAKTQ